jgi:hypothetical protein
MLLLMSDHETRRILHDPVSNGAVAVLCWRLFPELTRPTNLNPAFQLPSPFELASLPIARRFDFPLGGQARRPVTAKKRWLAESERLHRETSWRTQR